MVKYTYDAWGVCDTIVLDEIANISKPMANLFGYVDNMAFIARKSFSGAKFIDMGFDATRTLSSMHKHGKLGIEIFSRFTIYSERFVSIIFRKKNIVRILRRFYESFFGGEK